MTLNQKCNAAFNTALHFFILYRKLLDMTGVFSINGSKNIKINILARIYSYTKNKYRMIKKEKNRKIYGKRLNLYKSYYIM